MALFDYGNTRLRARLSNLFPIETLESLSELTAIDSFISTLSKSTYKQSIETALTFAHGYPCVTQALRIEMEEMVRELNKFYRDDALEKIQTIFVQDDLNNLKAIIRGISHGVQLEEILNSFSPLGSIPQPILTQLAKTKNVDELISKTVAFGLDISQLLVQLRAHKEHLKSSDIELELVKWYFSQIKRLVDNPGEDYKLLKDFYAIEADIINLNLLFRMVEAPESDQKLKDDFSNYLVDMGNISKNKIIQLLKMQSVEKVARDLFSTRYSSYFVKALECYRDTGRLSEFENQIRMYQLDSLAALPKSKPLGIGVPMGYIARKKSEVRNLRWIAKGIDSGFVAEFIKENLERAA